MYQHLSSTLKVLNFILPTNVLLSFYYNAGIITGDRDSSENKTDKNICLLGAYLWVFIPFTLSYRHSAGPLGLGMNKHAKNQSKYSIQE